MVIQLREVFEIPGEKLEFDYEITPEEASYINEVEFCDPIKIKGTIRNRSGMVKLNYHASFRIKSYCDRCLAPVDGNYDFDFEHYLVHSLQNEEDSTYDSYIVAEEDHIDLNDTVFSDILTELPSKVLCKEDCKGLCFICGCNLNERECGCQR